MLKIVWIKQPEYIEDCLEHTRIAHTKIKYT